MQKQGDEKREGASLFCTAGMLLHAPRFSKYLHGAAGLFLDTVEKMPYWYLHNTDGTFSPATWEEMADNKDEHYEEVSTGRFS